MTIFLGLLAAIGFGLFVFAFFKSKRLEKAVADLQQAAQQAKQLLAAAEARAEAEIQTALSDAQKLVDEQVAAMRVEAERVREHYKTEAGKIFLAADALAARLSKENEALKKYQTAVDAEAEAQRLLCNAMREATALRTEARVLVERARAAMADEKKDAQDRVRELGRQSDALLTQATKDAGRIVADAHNRAQEIAGDAYTALRDKEIFDKAALAMKHLREGYGDSFIIPTRNLLDDLAADFGHTAAGESLRTAKEHSRRMAEQGEAATSEYVEQDRRETAIRFVIDAFNGRVDAILSRTKRDNVGTLEQEIRDACHLVNLNGVAFRNTRILPAYLDARLAELKWGCIVQELRQKEREEQQRIREQIREEERARREYERAMKDAEREEEIIQKAMSAAQRQIETASAEQKAKYEMQLRELTEKLKQAEEVRQRALSMAQQTKRGKIYIISNVGSLGENIYKIGMTRRLVPQDRIDELGDASVPFPFDVHAWIESDDAPTLEGKLHEHFLLSQVNKVNHRKEFFRVDLAHIREEVGKLGFNTSWTMTADAAEYRETKAIERAIRDNPAQREAWLKRQLELEPAGFPKSESSDLVSV